MYPELVERLKSIDEQLIERGEQIKQLDARIKHLESVTNRTPQEERELDRKSTLNLSLYQELTALRNQSTEIQKTINNYFEQLQQSESFGNTQAHLNTILPEAAQSVVSSAGAAGQQHHHGEEVSMLPESLVLLSNTKRKKRDYFNRGGLKALRAQKWHRITKGTKRKRCIVCCYQCLAKDANYQEGAPNVKEHHRKGNKTIFGCVSCLSVNGNSTNVEAHKDDDILPLCDKPRFPGDPRTCFEIHHSKSVYPKLYCKGVDTVKGRPAGDSMWL